VVANMMTLETYMIVNFRVLEISQDTHKLARTLIYILKKKNICAIDQTQRKGAIHVNHSKNMISIVFFIAAFMLSLIGICKIDR
jgi:hypothetical protein